MSTDEISTAAGFDAAARSHAGPPLWHLIRMELEHEIRSGLIGPGARLPSEHELGRRYAVNRHTVRAAFAKLAELGLVVARRGSGVFVVDRSPEYPITRDSKWSGLESKLAAAPEGRMLAHYRREASPHIAALLGVETGSELIVVETLRTAAPRVATYGYHAFDATRFAAIETAFAETRSFDAALRRFGVAAFYRASTWLDCRMPRLCEANALGCDLDRPVMIMSYVDEDQSRQPVFYGISVLPSGSLTLRVDT